MMKKIPIPYKPVTRGKAEKALLWILRSSIPRNSGKRVIFEGVDWNRAVHPAFGTVVAQLVPSPLEITIRLRILKKGEYLP